MTRVEKILGEIDSLTLEERQKLIKLIMDKTELLNWLKISEKTFADWDNTEDEIYNYL